jgi:protein-tyrosine phosphatase
MTSILFVCTGNICRSPTAEAVFRNVVYKEQLKEKVTVDSAGTHGYHVGQPPDKRAYLAAQKRGIIMDHMKARQVTTKDFKLFNMIIAMDRGHLDILQEMQPHESIAQLSLFMDYCSDHAGHDVPDPYYGADEGFDTVLDIIEDGAQGLLKTVLTL